MAGYSGTPLVRKLGVKPGARVCVLKPPPGFLASLGELAPGARVVAASRRPADVILFFTRRRSELERRLPGLKSRLDPAGGLWIAWPKRASGVATDLSEDVVRGLALAARLVDNKACAIDEIWSGLRPGRAPTRPS